MKEEWRDIGKIKGIDYTSLYQVSNTGKVRNKKGKIINGYKSKCGYELVILSKNNIQKHYLVHRLVADAFIANPNNYPCVNHKSEIKTQNNVENLEWCDHKYNTNWGTCIKRRTEKTRNDKRSYLVLQIDVETNEVIKEYPSLRETERQTGFNHNHISECCRGIYKQYKGFKWQYKKGDC